MINVNKLIRKEIKDFTTLTGEVRPGGGVWEGYNSGTDY